MSIASKIMSYFSTKETSYEEQSPQKRRHSLRRKSSNGKENLETTLDESLVYENSNVKEEQKTPINKKSNTPLHDSICNESTIESPNQANILKNVDKINNTSEPGDDDENDIQNKNETQNKKHQENPTVESKDGSSVGSKNTEMFNSQDERMSDCSRENIVAVPRNENVAGIPSPSNSISNASSTNLKVTEEMVKEEEKMEAEGESELEEVRRKTLEELRRTGQKQRYDRLQVLLNRSNLYATYLLERMQEREKAEQKRQQKLEEKIKKKEDESVVNDGANKKSNRGRKKRKLEESDAKESEKKRVKTTDKEKEDIKPVEKEISIAELHLNRTINGENVDPRQPLLISGGVMRSYQLDGMEWLRGLFEHGINGILADEMGLGKTIQSISLITSLIEHHVVGPFIIIAPLSTLPNWVSEFKKFAPEVFTVLYHGNIEQRTNLRRKLMRVHKYEHGLRSLPVIVTSYEIAMRDRIPLSSFGYEWKYMIVDEGHRIKNLNCKLIRELKLYRVGNRLLLTGTPLQNNLAELWSLLNFLLPDIFDDLNSFQSWFDFSAMENNEQLIAQEQEAKVLQTLHSILTPFLLRRLKTDVDLSIPPKKEVLVYAPLTQKQQEFYKATLDRTIMNILEKNQRNEEEKIEYSGSGRAVRKTRKSVKYAEGDSQEFDFDALLKEAEDEEKRLKELKESKKKYDKKTVINIRMQNILMQLRKCVNHPYLIEFPFNTDTNELIIDENLVQSSGKLLLLDRMLPALLNQGHKVLIFSQMTQMLDIISDYCDIRSFKFSRIDGTMGIQERQDNIESFSNDADRNIFLLSTRAGGLGLNLMAADTCIIFDSDWNPQCDLQAQDRCHRIGQKKPVVVYRLVTANTVDERIIERAASKRKLEKMVIHKKNFKGRSFARAITPKELLDLLDSKDVSSVVGKQQEVITDEQLERLLDRSDLEDILEENNSKKNNSKKEISEDSSNTIFKVLDTNNDDDLVF